MTIPTRGLFLQGGSIPYGDVFGVRHGYSTVQEFVQYMDEYSSTLRLNGTGAAAPLYAFDPHILKEEFIGRYFLPGTAPQGSSVCHTLTCYCRYNPQSIDSHNLFTFSFDRYVPMQYSSTNAFPSCCRGAPCLAMLNCYCPSVHFGTTRRVL